DDGRGAAFDRLFRERGAVRMLALERDEHGARRHRARVVGDAGDNADGGFGAQRIVVPDQAAAAQRAVQLRPGYRWSAAARVAGAFAVVGSNGRSSTR